MNNRKKYPVLPGGALLMPKKVKQQQHMKDHLGKTAHYTHSGSVSYPRAVPANQKKIRRPPQGTYKASIPKSRLVPPIQNPRVLSSTTKSTSIDRTLLKNIIKTEIATHIYPRLNKLEKTIDRKTREIDLAVENQNLSIDKFSNTLENLDTVIKNMAINIPKTLQDMEKTVFPLHEQMMDNRLTIQNTHKIIDMSTEKLSEDIDTLSELVKSLSGNKKLLKDLEDLRNDINNKISEELELLRTSINEKSEALRISTNKNLSEDLEGLRDNINKNNKKNKSKIGLLLKELNKNRESIKSLKKSLN